MTSSQRDVTREALLAVHDFLGGPTADGDEWLFEFAEHLHSNWGAVYGGALAAGMLAVARATAPERAPRSMHVQIVRSVPSGPAWATATVRHPGRTVATVEVDLYDQRRKLAAIALFTMVTPEAVAASYDNVAAAPPIHLVEAPFDEDQIIPSGEQAGIVAALKLGEQGHQKGVFLLPDNVRLSVDGSVGGAFDCTVPWDQLDITGPEAACLAADAAIALPMTRSYIAVEDVGPNADLTLRFTSAPATPVILVASTMLSVQRGTATVGLEVQAGDNQLAHGLATALLLASS